MAEHAKGDIKMWKRITITGTILLALATALFPIETAWAEIKTVSGVTGRTFHDASYADWDAYTQTSSTAPYIYANIRAWGPGENPLKDQATAALYNTTFSGIDRVWDGYAAYYSSRHYVNTPYGAVEFYTSYDGHYSSYCWWSGGAACAPT